MNYARRLDRRAASRKGAPLAVKEQIRRGLMAERLEDRSLMAADCLLVSWRRGHSAYFNTASRTTSTRDGGVAPNDLLAIISNLNGYGVHELR